MDRSGRGGRDRASEPEQGSAAGNVARHRGRRCGRRRGDAYTPGARGATSVGLGVRRGSMRVSRRSAVEASRLGADRSDDELLSVAEPAALRHRSQPPGCRVTRPGARRRTPYAPSSRWARGARGRRRPRTRGGRRAPAGAARGREPRRAPPGGTGHAGHRRAGVGGGASLPSTHTGDDRAANDGRGRPCALASGPGGRTDGRARRLDQLVPPEGNGHAGTDDDERS